MLEPIYSAQFRKDFKLMKKRGRLMGKLLSVMECLQNEEPIDEKLHPHPLIGDYKGYWECHIEPDWLFVYLIDIKQREVYFARTGTHSDLF